MHTSDAASNMGEDSAASNVPGRWHSRVAAAGSDPATRAPLHNPRMIDEMRFPWSRASLRLCNRSSTAAGRLREFTSEAARMARLVEPWVPDASEFERHY